MGQGTISNTNRIRALLLWINVVELKREWPEKSEEKRKTGWNISLGKKAFANFYTQANLTDTN